MLNRKELLQKNLSVLLSYLGASNKPNFTNHIYTVPNRDVTVKKNNKVYTISKRSENNGLAQFSLFMSLANDGVTYSEPSRLYIRVENNVSNNTLSIISTKVEKLRKSGILAFGDENSFYVSIASSFGHAWLTDKKYCKVKAVEGPFGKYACYEYDIYKLLADKRIVGISNIPGTNTAVSYTGAILSNGESSERETFEYSHYEKEQCELSKLYMQNDPRAAAVIYYCYFGTRYTNLHNTIPGIAAEVCAWAGIEDETLVRHRLYRAKRLTNNTGVAHYVEFQLTEERADELRNSIQFDSELITDDNKLVIFLSNEKDFDVIENKKVKKTEDIKAYQKEYQKEYQKDYGNKYRKVKKWIKRNPGKTSFPKKWSEENIALANKLLSK